MALDPRGDIDEQREARRMRFREPVFAEAEDLLVDRVSELRGIAIALHSLFQLFFELGHAA
jgi:hypothetical protein